MTPAPVVLTVGARVRLRDLKAKPELNGQEGTLVEHQPAAGRWSVRLDTGSTFAFKDANLDQIVPRLALVCGSTSLQGVRESQEDRHVSIPDLAKASRVLKTPVCLDLPCAFFAVYDGHCGAVCSDFVAKNLHARLLRRLTSPEGGAAKPSPEQTDAALVSAFEDLDGEFLAKFRTAKDGTTAVAALVNGERLHVAWAGDSRCLLCRYVSGKVVAEAVSEDHRPTLQREADRVREAGGEVVDVGDNLWRVAQAGFEERNREIARAMQQGLGQIGKPPVALAVSRSFGDRDFKAVTRGKNLVSATPDVRSIELDESHAFMVLMSDGVTDVFGDQEIAEFLDKVRDPSDPHADARAAAAELLQESLRRGSMDNVTAIVCRFNWQRSESSANGCEPGEPPAKRLRGS